MWDELSNEEQLEPLCRLVGQKYDSVEHGLISQCEIAMNNSQRESYVENASAFVAAKTYQRVHPDSAAATELFYFNILTLTLNEKAMIIWHVLKGERL